MEKQTEPADEILDFKSTGMNVGLGSSEEHVQFFFKKKKNRRKSQAEFKPFERTPSKGVLQFHLKRMLRVIRMPARDGETARISRESRGAAWRDGLSKPG